jgi:hypothetical protein
LFVAGEGYSRKVDFEKFGVALAIGWGVEGGINVVKDVFWCKGFDLIAFAIWEKF